MVINQCLGMSLLVFILKLLVHFFYKNEANISLGILSVAFFQVFMTVTFSLFAKESADPPQI